VTANYHLLYLALRNAKVNTKILSIYYYLK